MKEFDALRRRVAGALGAGMVLGTLGACAATDRGVPQQRKALGRVLVVGAGFGGATAARYLKHWGGDAIEVVLVDREAEFISCPLSNLVLGGSRSIGDLTVGYQRLRDFGVTVVRDEVNAIDPTTRKVAFGRMADQVFDRIVVSPGVDFDFAAVPGLDAEARKTILHAWKAGEQTVALRRQLEAMHDGGVYVLTVPLAPYRCPPGPYERTCQVAHYFKTRKPRSKVIVLDANPEIVSKKGLFSKVFAEQYKGIVDYRPNSKVTEIDARSRTAITDLGDRVKADVLNVVPPQAAAGIARKAGLVNVNDRWCEVNWATLESTAARGIHVLGDATFSAPLMPKSGHMANQHGKSAAAAIIELMSGRAPPPPTMINTCYSFVDDVNVIHVASVHRYDAENRTMLVVAGSGGVSVEPTRLEGDYANAWAQNIWRDMFG